MTARLARVSARAGLCAAAASVLLLTMAGPAAADPARPGDFKSTVTRLDPPVDGVTVKVVGGDGFLRVHAEPGHEVEVLGYSGEPWLRIGKDGTVEENQRSPATYLNADRYGRTQPPTDITNACADADSTTCGQPVEYQKIGDGGTYTWHDHRIHWMSPSKPPNAKAGDVVFPDWTVAMRVDGKPVIVHGTLVWEKGTYPVLWFGLAVLAFAVAMVIGRGKSVTVAAVCSVIAGAAALVVGFAEHAAVPAAAGGSPLVVILPAVGLGAGIVGVILRHKPLGVVAVIASVAALASWGIFRLTVLLKPVLPTHLNYGVDRTITAVTLGLAVAAAVMAVRSGGLVPRLPDLDFADDAPATAA
jgi:hypothetical protein